MPEQKKIYHLAASFARKLHLWPVIARSGVFNLVRRKRYPDTIVRLDIVLTECCTLRCRDCSNLMQYYEKPENLDPEEVISSLQRRRKTAMNRLRRFLPKRRSMKKSMRRCGTRSFMVAMWSQPKLI